MIKKKEHGIGIDLIQLFRTLWRNAPAIVLSALLFAAAAFAYTWFFVTPTYEAVASLYVNNSSFSFGSTSFSISSSEISASNSLVNSYIYLLKSRETLEAVIADTGVSYSYKELRNEIITVKAVQSTPAFDVTVTSSDPQEAELIANSIAKILPQRVAEIVEGASVRVVDHAIIPAQRSSPNYTKNMLVYGMIGAFAAVVWCIIVNIIRELQNETIGSSDNVIMQYPQLQILATIPDMDISEKKGYYDYSYYKGQKGQKKGKK